MHGGTAMYIIRPFLLIRIILEQPVSLRRKPDISIGILIYVHDPGTKISYSGKVILFPVIQVYSRHGSYPNTCFTVLKDSIRTASIKGSGISRFSCINPNTPVFVFNTLTPPYKYQSINHHHPYKVHVRYDKKDYFRAHRVDNE